MAPREMSDIQKIREQVYLVASDLLRSDDGHGPQLRDAISCSLASFDRTLRAMQELSTHPGLASGPQNLNEIAQRVELVEEHLRVRSYKVSGVDLIVPRYLPLFAVASDRAFAKLGDSTLTVNEESDRGAFDLGLRLHKINRHLVQDMFSILGCANTDETACSLTTSWILLCASGTETYLRILALIDTQLTVLWALSVREVLQPSICASFVQ